MIRHESSDQDFDDLCCISLCILYIPTVKDDPGGCRRFERVQCVKYFVVLPPMLWEL